MLSFVLGTLLTFSTVHAAPPVAPTSLTATALSPSEIRLNWVDRSNNEDRFVVERGTAPSDTFKQIVDFAGPNAVTFTDKNLEAGKTYYYRIRARSWENGKAVFSTYSNVANATTQPPHMPAFPQALGAGAATQGGRGGAIIYITNLNDSGAGSFRECMAVRTGRRICIPRVAGIIRLKSPVIIDSNHGNVSFLGQAAPGGGLLLTIDQSNTSGVKTPLVTKGTTQVIIRHLRVRLQYPSSVENADSITIENSKQVYVDHFSGSWATDENFNSFKDTNNLTVAYSMFGEGLLPHSKCALMADNVTIPQNIHFIRNMCISNNDRNPDNNHIKGGCIVNAENIFYNPQAQFAEIFGQRAGGATEINFIGNLFKAGPSTRASTNGIDWDPTASTGTPVIYQWGNKVFAPSGKTVNLIAPDTTQFLVSVPTCQIPRDGYFATNGTKSGMTSVLYGHVRSQAGAFPRDAVDKRYATEVGAWNQPGTSSRGIISAAPALPAIATGKAYVDSDADGMPDSLEAARGGVVGNKDSWKVTASGWTVFDLVMHDLHSRRLSGQYAP